MKKKTFWVFQAPFWNSHFFDYKEKFSILITPKMLQNNKKSIVYLNVTLLGEKNSFYLYLSPFYWFDQKQFFKQIQIFLRIYSFQTY